MDWHLYSTPPKSLLHTYSHAAFQHYHTHTHSPMDALGELQAQYLTQGHFSPWTEVAVIKVLLHDPLDPLEVELTFLH